MVSVKEDTPTKEKEGETKLELMEPDGPVEIDLKQKRPEIFNRRRGVNI